MSTQVDVSRFVKPYFIEELGQEGLTLADIAKSLGQEAFHFRANFKRSFEDRCKSLNLLTTSVERVHPGNGTMIQDIAVSVDCAKWLVAKSNTEAGDSYTAYLIGLERNVNELKEIASNDPLLASLMVVQSIRIKQIEQERRIAALEVESNQQQKQIASLNASSNYVSAMGFLKSKIKVVSNTDALKLGRRASKMCRESGIKIDTVHSEVHGKVNTYPEDLLESAYSSLNEEEFT